MLLKHVALAGQGDTALGLGTAYFPNNGASNKYYELDGDVIIGVNHFLGLGVYTIDDACQRDIVLHTGSYLVISQNTSR